MDSGLERRISIAFRIAGGLMLAAGLLVSIGVLFGLSLLSLLPFVLLLSGLGSLSALVGLLGVISKLRIPMRWIARLAVAVTVIGAIASLSMTLLAVVSLIEPWFSPQTFRMDIILDALALSVLITLAALLVALSLVGTAVRRAGLGIPGTGPLLITGGLLTLVPPVLVLLSIPEWSLPPWLWLVVFGGWAVLFFVVGSAFAADRSARGDVFPLRSGAS